MRQLLLATLLSVPGYASNQASVECLAKHAEVLPPNGFKVNTEAPWHATAPAKLTLSKEKVTIADIDCKTYEVTAYFCDFGGNNCIRSVLKATDK